MQCPCDSLLADCWGKFCKVKCWNNFNLDFMFLGDNLIKILYVFELLDVFVCTWI